MSKAQNKDIGIDEDVKNEFLNSVSPVTIIQRPLRFDRLVGTIGLSPISEITLTLEESKIGTTPKRTYFGENCEATIVLDSDSCDSTSTLTNEEFLSDSQNESLISNSFTLNSGGRSSVVRRAEARARGVQRCLNSSPVCLSYENPDSPEKTTMSTEDLSLYAGNSPQASPRPCSISPCMEMGGFLSPENSPSRFIVVQENSKNVVTLARRSFDEQDANSMDSGYSASFGQENLLLQDNKPIFKFVQPCGVAPRRIDPSPRKITSSSTSSTTSLSSSSSSSSSSSTSPKSTSSFRVFNSLSSGSMESMDDEYMDLIEMEELDDNAQLPSNINSLISGQIKSIKNTPESKRPLVRRCLSLTDNVTDRARSALFEPKTPEILRTVQENISSSATPYSSRTGDNSRCFKRPEPPCGSPVQSKRYKSELQVNEIVSASSPPTFSSSNGKENLLERFNNDPKRHILKKSMSMNDAMIMSALSRSSSEPDLIGDFSKPFCLPLMEGRHRDLKSISVHTMAKLVRGNYSDSIASFKIIDCRYPYEYEGGHIGDAYNLYTQEQILKELVNTKTESATVDSDEQPKRHILVFHCEFSSERGPKLSRFLRNHDRHCNTDSYPALHYPEIYLLHGGYKEFFESYPQLCEPNSYRPMLHPSFEADFKHFRAKSKSWNGEAKATVTTTRLVKSRSRLVL